MAAYHEFEKISGSHVHGSIFKFRPEDASGERNKKSEGDLL